MKKQLMTILLSVLISVVGTKALAHGIEKNADDVINFADTNVKAICLNYWDTNGDGELSMAEAAAVTNLGMVFYDKSITEFNELQYFTGLTSIYREAFSRCVDLISITIPNNVTTIDKYAFQGCSSLNALTIPNSVTTIDSYAFSGCSSLKSLTMQNGVTSIGDNAFNYCSSLESITIPNSVTSIGSGAFQGCSSLASITIPNSVTFIGSGAFNGTPWYNTWYNNQPDGLIYIGKIAYKYKGKMPANSSINILNGTLSIGVGAFSGCSGLVSVSIPNSVTDIGAAAFSGCSGLVSVSIPNSVTNIGINAFQYCSALTSITIPKSVTNIDCTACRGCYALISMIVEDGNTTYDSRDNCNAIIETSSNTLIAGCKSTVIPSTVTAIGQLAFDDCANLTTITIPDNVTSIGKYAFNNCNGLTSISIPHNVTSIGFYAFSDCNNLASITIPATVTSIGDYAFNPCPKLKSVTVKNPTPVAIETTTFDNQYNAKLYVPAGSVEAYQSANYWKDFTVVANIAYAVYDNGTLTFKYGEFTPNGTTSWDVSNTPFNGFLPSSLTWEGGLKHVVFDASFAEARPKSCSYWFDASKELESIEGLEYLNTSEVTTMNCMFEFCPKLTSLDLTHFDTSNVTDMGNMFAGTTGLTTLDLSSFNTSKVTIMTNMFAGSASETYGGSNKVETIYVGDGWTTDGITSASNGARMFDYCPNLKGGNGTTFNADHTDYTYARIDAPGTPGYLSKKGQTTTTTWTVTSTDNIPAGTKYELEDITLTIGEAGSNDFAVNEWGEPYDETFKNLICGNGVNGNKEGGTFYLFKPKKNGNLTVYVSQNPVKKLYVEESGRVMDAFNGISHEEITEGQYKGTYTIPVYANLTYKLYCAGSKLSFYGFTFEGRNDADKTNITFADEKVKALCIANWDTDHNGELSMTEAAAVATIGEIFKENEEITSFDELRFFTGLTELTGACFYTCTKLKSITIPSGITNIAGGYAFGNCAELEQISVDAGNTAFDSRLQCNAIIETASNTLVVGCQTTNIPATVTAIGGAAFWGRWGMSWMDIPESVSSIDYAAFAYCPNLWSIQLPKGLTHIGEDAFNESNLTEVKVQNPVPVVLENANTFSNRANATLYVPVGCKAAYEAAPIWKEFKRIVETGWAVTSTDEIPAGTVIELDDITMTIGEAGSPNFTVDTWDSYDEPFTKRIVGNGVNGDREGGTFYLFKPKKNGTLKVIVRQSVKNPKKFYVEESGRVIDAFNGILPETTDDVYIGPYTIPVFANLTYKIYCAGSKMGFYGFTFEGRDDAEWTNIEFADEKVKALCIANWDTDHNGELSMTEAAAVTDLGEVFKQNEEITSFDELRFFTGLTDIPGWNTFNGCHSLTSVTIPASVTSIEGATFANCEALEHISVDPSNTKYCTLQNCNAIIERETNKLVVGCKAAEIPDGVTVIGTEAFHGSTLIQWIGIPESVTELEAGAFAWCISLEGVEIPSSVTKIGDWAFHQTALWSVTLPEKLTTIGENAFKDCNNLNEVNVMNPEPVVLTNAETFSNCANATLNVPKDSRAAYEAAEYWKDFGMIVNVLAEENWADPYWFGVDDGVGATYKMTAEGLAITNPTVQEERWKLQTIVIQNVRLQQNHSYKVIVNAKIPSAGKLQVNLCNWENSWDNDISVNASNDFQDFEFLYEDCPYYTESGFLFFQNGCIKGTSVVRNVQILDITDGEEVIAEKNWASPYWFADEGTGATFTMTDEGLAIKNPKVQNEAWTPQTMILKDASLQKNHTYKVIVNAKIPSDGDLQMQLGSWASDVYEHQCIAVNASSDFQDLEFIYRDFPADAEGAFVVFQNGFIAGTSIVRNVRILDMGDNPVELVYSYNDEDHTAEVIKNDKGKYKGDVTIPATVSHNGKEYTVTMIKEEAFNGSNITSITIPATMKTIEPHSFAGTNDLMKITVDPANTVFDSRDNCNGIIEKATNKLVVGCQETVIPDGITIIGEGAFHSRHQMTSMTIPESVKSIEAGAFAGCYNLAEVQLPANLESLGWWAFLATPIKSITLPATLTSIGSQAFDGCSQLTEVTALNPAPIEIDGSAFSNRANATLYLPAGAKKAYKAAPIWKEFKETVEAEHNSVYSYDLTAYLGVSTGMEINLENWDPFTAYQFDIVLPNGITLEKKADGKGIKFTKGKRCAGSRSISVTARDNNTYRVVCISTKNEVITGNDGALLTVYLVANENMGTKTCQAEIKNVIMTTPEEKQVNFDPTTVTITTKTLLLGDSNDDEFVNVTDLVATINYILGRPSDKFNKTAADISKNHVVDIFDVNLGLGLIKNGTRGARMMTRAAAAANDKMTIRDLSISAGMTKQLQVELTNEGAYTGFQFDLVLPEGIKMTSYSTTARIPEDMIVDYNETEGVYRFLGGLGESAISGNSGSIINITVKADENLKGRNLTGYLRDVKLGLATGDGPTIEETPFKITDETSGDMNKNGKLDPADVKAIVELIMKGEYNVKADANGDSKVNAADIVVVTNEINKK